jgi:hypothetical protein
LYNSPKSNIKKTRVFPQGLALAGDEMTSFVLFKDKKGTISFPVWCPVLPIGLVPQDGDYNLKNPYEFTHELLEKLDYEITKCVFDQIESDEQKASLYIEKKKPLVVQKKSASSKKTTQMSFLEGNLKSSEELFRSIKTIPMKAFEALALCSPKKDIIFSATKDFIRKTRDVAVFEKSNPSDLLKKNSFLKSRQKYLM